MLPDLKEPFYQQTLEVVKDLAILPTHYVDVFLSQLKRGAFKVYPSWSALKHKAKVYMNNMTFRVQENIPIVSVFDVEDVIKQAVASQTLGEILLSLFKIIDEILIKEGFQRPNLAA